MSAPSNYRFRQTCHPAAADGPDRRRLTGISQACWQPRDEIPGRPGKGCLYLTAPGPHLQAPRDAIGADDAMSGGTDRCPLGGPVTLLPNAGHGHTGFGSRLHGYLAARRSAIVWRGCARRRLARRSFGCNPRRVKQQHAGWTIAVPGSSRGMDDDRAKAPESR